jgi:hypothetical protein
MVEAARQIGRIQPHIEVHALLVGWGRRGVDGSPVLTAAWRSMPQPAEKRHFILSRRYRRRYRDWFR